MYLFEMQFKCRYTGHNFHNFLNNETPAHVLSCEFYETFRVFLTNISTRLPLKKTSITDNYKFVQQVVHFFGRGGGEGVQNLLKQLPILQCHDDYCILEKKTKFFWKVQPVNFSSRDCLKTD